MKKGMAKIHPIALLGVVGVVAIVVILFMTGDSAQSRANLFMAALAEGNAEKAAELSDIANLDEAAEVEAWKETVKRSRHYLFSWTVMGAVPTDSERTSVRMRIVRNVSLNAYEEPFDVVMVKKDGEWLVDTDSLSRDIFPWLPTGFSLQPSAE